MKNPPESPEPGTNPHAGGERVPAGSAAFRSWVRWLPRGLAIGIVLTFLIAGVTHLFLEPRAGQALTQGTLMSACMVDWSRRREAPWWAFAATVGIFLVLSFAVAYLLPQ
jgi:hypothetical protein